MREEYKNIEFYRENLNKDCFIYHSAEDRAYWDNLKGEYFDALKQRKDEDNTYTVLKLSDYLKTTFEGDRATYEAPYFNRRSALVKYCVLEALENKGTHKSAMLDLLWMILEETQWVVPAHSHTTKNHDVIPHEGDSTIDLFTGETSAVLSAVYSIHKKYFDGISAEIGNRLKRKIEAEVYDNFLENDYKWMTGFKTKPNNWNPWIVSSILETVINLGEYGEKELKIITRCAEVIDKYYTPYPDDGGCDEGVSYWSHAIGNLVRAFYSLKILTNGKMDEIHSEKVQRATEFVCQTFVSDNHILGFSDATVGARYAWEIYSIVAKYAENEKLLKFARYLYEIAKKDNFKSYTTRIDKTLYCCDAVPLMESMECEPFKRETACYYDGIKLMVLRESEDGTGFFLAAKANHNHESHNHNDTGNFIIYKNSVPIIIDAGAKTYTKKTFSEERYNIWNNQSAYHNLPILGGVQQSAGIEFYADNVEYNDDKMSFDIKNAYDCDFIKKCARTIQFDRVNTKIIIDEDIELTEEKEVEFVFITPCEVDIKSGITLSKDGESVYITPDTEFDIQVEPICDDDRPIVNAWGNSLKRIRCIKKLKKQAIRFEIK